MFHLDFKLQGRGTCFFSIKHMFSHLVSFRDDFHFILVGEVFFFFSVLRLFLIFDLWKIWKANLKFHEHRVLWLPMETSDDVRQIIKISSILCVLFRHKSKYHATAAIINIQILLRVMFDDSDSTDIKHVIAFHVFFSESEELKFVILLTNKGSSSFLIFV